LSGFPRVGAGSHGESSPCRSLEYIFALEFSHDFAPPRPPPPQPNTPLCLWNNVRISMRHASSPTTFLTHDSIYYMHGTSFTSLLLSRSTPPPPPPSKTIIHRHLAENESRPKRETK
jgi:hypothetical protein